MYAVEKIPEWIKIKDKLGNTCLHQAAYSGRSKGLREILKNTQNMQTLKIKKVERLKKFYKQIGM